MPQFRKKPVVIEAEQFIEGAGIRLPFVNGHSRGPMHFDAANARWFIETLEGRMTVQNRDWIIRGVKGEFYPCKPDIFAQTYEPVDA